MTPQQMQMLYSQMAQRAIAPQMARMQPPAAQAMPRVPVARQAVAPRQQQVQQQQQWGIGRGTRGPALSPDAVAAQREDERRRAAEKAAQRQLELSRPRSYASGPPETQEQFDQRMRDFSAMAGNWISMNPLTGQLTTNIQPFGYTDQAGRYIGPYQQGHGNYVAPILDPQSLNATPYTT